MVGPVNGIYINCQAIATIRMSARINLENTDHSRENHSRSEQAAQARAHAPQRRGAIQEGRLVRECHDRRAGGVSAIHVGRDVGTWRLRVGALHCDRLDERVEVAWVGARVRPWL